MSGYRRASAADVIDGLVDEDAAGGSVAMDNEGVEGEEEEEGEDGEE